MLRPVARRRSPSLGPNEPEAEGGALLQLLQMVSVTGMRAPFPVRFAGAILAVCLPCGKCAPGDGFHRLFYFRLMGIGIMVRAG